MCFVLENNNDFCVNDTTICLTIKAHIKSKRKHNLILSINLDIYDVLIDTVCIENIKLTILDTNIFLNNNNLHFFFNIITII